VTQETAHAALGEWETFYLIVGSSAAALTGLQFVVITLVTEGRSRSATTPTGIDAFATPTIVHFSVALFVSVTMCSPWPRLFGPALVVGAAGMLGLIYTAIVITRARRQTGYTMVAEDWIWHVILPLIAYATLLVSSTLLPAHTYIPLFAIAGATLLFVYIGIHNAWDTSTYMVAQRLEREREANGARDDVPTPRTELGTEPVAASDPVVASDPVAASDADR
jgi:hypothetical protein